MKISTAILKRFIDVIPSDDVLYDLTNRHITEVESIIRLLDVENLVVGHVLECDKHPNSDHLSVCKVDVGSDVKQIVCGASNVAKGQYVVVALEGAILPGDFTIKHSTIRGIDSYGMICSLNELNVDEKYIEERFKNGIYYFDSEQKVGSNAVEALNFNQVSLEIDVTANRTDLLSVLGFAYDLGAVLNQKISIKEPSILELGPYNPLKVIIEDEGCKRYYARYIDNITVKPSPIWMQASLIASGIRPINNVVDVTNYVLMEMGTPLHAFDADKFGSETIVVKKAKDLDEVITLDEQSRILRKKDIVITNGEKPVAIGGVMGLLNSSVSEDTTKIILEAAWFEPSRIKETAERLNLHSDSSLRFEKYVDEIRILQALNRASELLEEISNARVYKEVAFEGKPFNRPTLIALHSTEVNKLLGTELTTKEVSTLLKRLNIIETKPNVYLVPSYRRDLKIKEDLIEEVARIHGYNQIDTVLPVLNSIGKHSNKQRHLHTIRRHMIGLGFNEVINYSLIGEESIHMYAKSSKDIIHVLSPLSDDKRVLRHSLINGLVKNVEHHVSRQMNDLHLFEIGRVYYTENEPTYLSAIINGKYIKNSVLKNDLESNFLLIKGVLENVIEKIGFQLEFIKEDTIPGYHPGVCAKVIYDKDMIGYVGKIHPTILDDAYAFEINLDKLIPHINTLHSFEPVSKYPSVSRDLSVIVDNEVSVDSVLNLIRQTTKRYLTNIELFDFYEDEKIGLGKKSLAFSMTFNSKEQTLLATDVDKLMGSVMIRLQRELKAEIRK